MSQVHLSYINTTDTGINMMVSWVTIGTPLTTSYNIIFPIVGISIITTFAAIAYYRSKAPALFDCYVYNSHIFNFTNRDTQTCGFCSVYFILLLCSILSGLQFYPVVEQVTYCNTECVTSRTTKIAMLSPSKTMYSAPMYNLAPQTKYNYRISDSENPIEFTTLNPSAPRIAVIGDFGYENAAAFKSLHDSINDYDMVIHLGDIAYDLEEEGDAFMNMIEPISSKKPYMTTPGNHEKANNFSYYRTLFNMPQMFYSFKIGTAHFISLSSELYFHPHLYSNYNILQQYYWLENVLRENINATSIVYTHRPMYCSMTGKRCTEDTKTMRKGMSYDGKEPIAPLEQLLYKYGVQVYFAGHIHSYERTKPVYDSTVQENGGIVHILNGVGGSREGLDTAATTKHDWSAYLNTTYGYGILNVHGKNMNWRQFTTDGKTIDKIDLNR
uniref:Calcineurin-like phosphoesterase domain-containing protein n=1 Tax=viral metagenome TaxID=1070528 RepID=A0A6C0BV91_9ZZZZ